MESLNSKMHSEIYQQNHFNILQATFWDTKETITKNYESLLKILKENESKSPEERKNYGITPELLEISYKILTDPNERENYLSFLKYYYFLSEPTSLQQLKKSYHNKIFPYYIFTIKTKEKQQICDLTIDFISKKITITHKDKLLQSILSSNIITVNKKFGTSISIMIQNENPKEKKNSDKNKSKSEFKEIEFDPEISQQIDIIYTIISYFAKSIEDNNFYSLLQNDVYRPCGIILRGKILKEHQIKILGKDDRYAVLGPSMVIIYKNEELKEIRNVLPLCPFLMRVNYVEKENKIEFIYPNREQSLSFYDKEHFTMWMTTLKEIFIGRIKNKMDTVQLLEVNEMKEKEKIIKEIGIEIECAEEEIKVIKNKVEQFTNRIQNKNIIDK
jgi:hypothetical protein